MGKWVDGERITKRNEIEAMGFTMTDVMTTMVNLFAAQVKPLDPAFVPIPSL